MNELKEAFLKTTATRDHAEALLEGLLHAREAADRDRKRENRIDLMEEVCGKTSVDDAIESTRRMIDTLNRVLAKARTKLSQQEQLDISMTCGDSSRHELVSRHAH